MFLVMNLAIVTFASDSTENETKVAEKVKSEIAKLGTGTDARIQLKLKDGKKLKGYISEADDKGFVVVDSEGKATAVPYSQPTQINGKHIAKKVVFVLIALAVTIAVVAIIVGSQKD